MEKIKVRLSKEVEKSIKDFEKTTNARKLQSVFKDGVTLDDFIVLTTLGKPLRTTCRYGHLWQSEVGQGQEVP